MISEQAERAARALRPQHSIARQGAMTAFALCTPLFGVLYFLTIPVGAWLPVLVAHLLVLATCVVAAIAFFGTEIRVTPLGITERTLRGKVRSLHRSQIDALLVAHVYQGLTMNTQPQLFIIDIEGRRVLRMRGPIWTAEDMMEVARVLDVPITTISELATKRDLRQSHPHLLHWLERRPVVSAFVFGTTLVAIGAAVTLAVTSSIGMPFGSNR